MTDEIDALARLNASCAARGLEGQCIMAESVDPDVREGAVAWLRERGFPSSIAEADMIERGEYDDHSCVKALARMKAAGREQGLREAIGWLNEQGMSMLPCDASVYADEMAEALLSEKPA